MTVRVLVGDLRERLKDIADESVHCVVTSPPYFGLRDYGTASWEGGDPGCDHKQGTARQDGGRTKVDGFNRSNNGYSGGAMNYRDACGKCGATRTDKQIGLEPTPAAFVEVMVEVFREVRRVLRKDGTLWLNLGDSYATQGGRGEARMAELGRPTPGALTIAEARGSASGTKMAPGLKPKDLIGIPWRVAFALQQPYYTGKIKDEIDRVWLAAMVDAEGSICGSEYETGERTKTNIYISVTNTSVPIIDKCERLFPQTVKHVYEKSGPSSRICYRWDVERMETKALFLREIYPYLVAKRKQAAVAYTFIEMQRGLISKKKGYLPDQQEQRSWLMATLSRLNAGDDVDLPEWIVEPPSLFEPGFYLRQDIIWAKPNPMPESVTDRCTKSHEYLFLLTKSARYYFDAEAIKEPAGDNTHARKAGPNSRVNVDRVPNVRKLAPEGVGIKSNASFYEATADVLTDRNKRSVWTIATQPYSDAHFATFPPDLVEPCILAATARETCKTCGAPWRILPARAALVVDGIEVTPAMPARPWCGHDAPGGPTCAVLDPFGGAGTTALVADRLGRDAAVIELNPEYVALIERRIRGDAGMFASFAAE